jgi:hypothetical protein
VKFWIFDEAEIGENFLMKGMKELGNFSGRSKRSKNMQKLVEEYSY